MLLNKSCLEVNFPDGLMITDPPYNIGYGYVGYNDRLKKDEYLSLLKVIRPPCVIIQYPEFMMNYGKELWGEAQECVFWVYNSNTAKQSRLITWYGCKPDFKKIPQPYKNPKDKRIAKRIADGKHARGYDWWEINQVKNVSKKHGHPCSIPEELTRRIILSTAKNGETIIDPFMGVGTILEVANNMKYKIFGTEIVEKYYKESKKRLQFAYNLL